MKQRTWTSKNYFTQNNSLLFLFFVPNSIYCKHTNVSITYNLKFSYLVMGKTHFCICGHGKTAHLKVTHSKCHIPCGSYGLCEETGCDCTVFITCKNNVECATDIFGRCVRCTDNPKIVGYPKIRSVSQIRR